MEIKVKRNRVYVIDYEAKTKKVFGTVREAEDYVKSLEPKVKEVTVDIIEDPFDFSHDDDLVL